MIFIYYLSTLLENCYDEGSTNSCEYRKSAGLNFCSGPLGKIKCKKTCGYCTVQTTQLPNNTKNVSLPTPSSRSCGFSNTKIGRIVNGVNTKRGEWPWMVSIQELGSHYCGGTLIDPKWVSCFYFIVSYHNINIGLMGLKGTSLVVLNSREETQQTV